MGASTEIELKFRNRGHADRAHRIARDMIRLWYAPEDGALPPDGTEDLTDSERLPLARERLGDYDPVEKHPWCALAFLELEDRRVVIRRCADLQCSMNIVGGDPDEFFIQLCFAVAAQAPGDDFAGLCTYEQTTSGFLELTRAEYRGGTLRLRQIWGEIPFDSDDWSRALQAEWKLENGRFVPGTRQHEPAQRTGNGRGIP